MQADDIKKADWAIAFTQKNLKGLREGDWLNLREELYDFLYWWDPDQYPSTKKNRHGKARLIGKVKSKFVKETTISDVERIQKDLSEFLHRLITGDGWIYRGFPTKESHTIFGSRGPQGLFESFTYIEDDSVAAKNMLGDSLVGSGLTREQIRLCPECNRRFLLKRKPRKDRTFYCSPKCASTSSSRAHRKRKPGHLKVVQRKRGTDRLETGSRGKRTA